MSFITLIVDIVFKLMPFKLLQTKQSLMINWKPNAKVLVPNDENNHKHIH